MKTTQKPISVKHTALALTVQEIVKATPVFDIHTHLYEPAFGKLLLWGIDDLLVYHYLVAEAFRYMEIPYDKFWVLSKQQQADLIWAQLFIEHSPLSEACRGVLTTLHQLGLDVRKRDLPALRKWFMKWSADEYVTRCMELANCRQICMTNSPFDDVERAVWEGGFVRDGRFTTALRIDPLLMDWPSTASRLVQWGYNVRVDCAGKTMGEVRRFLADWTKRFGALYAMVSLPPDFAYPSNIVVARLLDGAVLPFCAETGIAFAMMPGVKRAVNSLLKLAGDGVGRSDLDAYERMIAAHPENKFLLTVLERSNQHQVCVMARKFRNLHVFGCWWFLNNPSMIEELTRMRIEMLGLSMTPQHSDARVMDQIIYKWSHSRQIIADVLTDKYADILATGWQVSRGEMERDAAQLLGGSFDEFLKR